MRVMPTCSRSGVYDQYALCVPTTITKSKTLHSFLISPHPYLSQRWIAWTASARSWPSRRRGTHRTCPLPTNPRRSHHRSAPTTASPALAIPLVRSRSAPVLEFPAVNVPGSSPKSLIGASSSSPDSDEAPITPISPLKKTFGTFFKSFRGRNPFDADEDEFDRGRKYSTATLAKDAYTSTRLPQLGHPAVTLTSELPNSATDSRAETSSSRFVVGAPLMRTTMSSTVGVSTAPQR